MGTPEPDRSHATGSPDARGFLRQFCSFFAFAGLFSLAINLLLLMPALFMLQVFDRVLSSRHLETLVVLGLGVVFAMFLMMVLEMVRARLLGLAGIAFDKTYAASVVHRELERAVRAGRSAPANGIHDVAVLRRFLSGVGILALFDSPWMLIYLLVIFVFHPWLGVTAAVGAVLLLLITFTNERLAREPVIRIQAASRQSLHYLDSAVRNAEVIAGMGMAGGVTAGWQRHNAGLLREQERASNIAGYIGGLGKFTRQVLQSGMLAMAAWLVIRQEVTSGAMIASTIIYGRALQPLEMLIASWRSLLETRDAYARLKPELGRTAEAQAGAHSSAHTTELPAPQGRVAVEGVWFGPPGREKPTLRGVSFVLAPGEALAVLGPSASGKTTLLRIIMGIWQASSGAVRIDGADVASWPRARLGPHLGYLPQDIELFDGTVAENIARLGPVSSEAVIEAARQAGAHEMILRLEKGYDTPIGDVGASLSGGQRQRVALARALYGNPRIVVLDEPDASLDAEGEAALLRTIDQLKRAGTTQIIVSHRPPLVSIVDKIMILGDGQLQFFGGQEEFGSRVRQFVKARDGLRAVDGAPAPGDRG